MVARCPKETRVMGGGSLIHLQSDKKEKAEKSEQSMSQTSRHDVGIAATTGATWPGKEGSLGKKLGKHGPPSAAWINERVILGSEKCL